MSNRQQKGHYNAVCDSCGFVFPASELRKRPEDGMMVCKKDWEPVHPQKYIKAKPDISKLPWVRPDSDEVNIGPLINCNTRPYFYNSFGHFIIQDVEIFKEQSTGPLTILSGVIVTVHCTLEIV